MKFEAYHFTEGLNRGIESLGWRRPTDIQFKSITSILQGEDVLAVAQTGTGKTAAFAIPIIERIERQKWTERRPDGLKCIILTPTHELVLQIVEVFEKLAEHTEVDVVGLIGGEVYDEQVAALNRRVDIAVATPGRLFDLIHQGHVKTHRIQTLVLDEADQMLDLGFIKDIRQLVNLLPERRQTLFFSATIDDYIKKVAYGLVKSSAIRIQISPKNPVAGNILHQVSFMEMDDKRFFLERLIKEHPDQKIIVFVRTLVRAERVQKAMDRVGLATLCIHRDIEQQERQETLDLFKQGIVPVLIATDIAARGIDVPDIYYVVNYDVPEQAETYVHRIGRTGRIKKKGYAITFCAPNEKKLLQEIEAFTGDKIEVMHIDSEDYQDTLLFSDEHGQDWRKLMEMAEELEKTKKKKRKKS